MTTWGQRVGQWIGLDLNKKASAVGKLIGGTSKAELEAYIREWSELQSLDD